MDRGYQPYQGGQVALKPYPNTPGDELDRLILEEMGREQVVGVSAVFVKNGEVIWSRGYGWADLENERPADASTIYRIASISKTITATALMQLFEKGYFSLDDDIGDYLGYRVRNPNYPDIRITFRMLLTHTSSILDGGYNRVLDSPNPPPLKELLVPGGSAYTPDTWGDYPPGTRFVYSNFGAGIVACLVEVLSGQNFDTYAISHIFTPLGMDAGYEVADLAHPERLAVLYRPAGNGNFTPACDYYPGGQLPPRRPQLPLGNYYIGPAGAVRTSALDLARFMTAQMQAGVYRGVRILKEETADLMQQIQWYGYGYQGLFRMIGLFIHITDALAGRRLRGHPGEACGLLSDMYFSLDEQAGVVFMTNGGYYIVPEGGYAGIEETVINNTFRILKGPPAPDIRSIKAASGAGRLVVNGRGIYYLVPAEVIAGDLYIPAENLADALDAGIQDEAGGYLALTRKGSTVRVRSGEAVLQTGGGPVSLAAPPFLKGGHLMLPLAATSRVFGAGVSGGVPGELVIYLAG